MYCFSIALSRSQIKNRKFWVKKELKKEFINQKIIAAAALLLAITQKIPRFSTQEKMYSKQVLDRKTQDPKIDLISSTPKKENFSEKKSEKSTLN
jgi:hypothetical protein